MNGASTLEQLENDYWGDPPKNSSSLVRTCHELRKKKIIELEEEDLRVLINQNIGLPYLIPIAINRLKENPFIEASYYEGDLLKSVLSSDSQFWKSNSSLKEDVTNILKENESRLNELDTTEEIRDELKGLFKKFAEIK